MFSSLFWTIHVPPGFLSLSPRFCPSPTLVSVGLSSSRLVLVSLVPVSPGLVLVAPRLPGVLRDEDRKKEKRVRRTLIHGHGARGRLYSVLVEQNGLDYRDCRLDCRLEKGESMEKITQGDILPVLQE